MRILITGGNGYIANSIFNQLNDYDITKISRSDFDLSNRDLVNNFFKKNGYFDVLIHTAVVGGSRLKLENSYTLDQNLKMYYNLLENKNNFKKFISFGSGAEIYSLNTPYGLSKKIIAESIKDKENFYNLRIFAVFDENELETRFIKGNIIRFLNKESIEIYQNKKMDFFYMKDLISTIKYYIDTTNPPKEVNCVYKEKYTLIDIANIINNLDDYQVNIKISDIYSDDYIGEFNLPINTIGFKLGIKNVYSILKNKNTDKNKIVINT